MFSIRLCVTGLFWLLICQQSHTNRFCTSIWDKSKRITLAFDKAAFGFLILAIIQIKHNQCLFGFVYFLFLFWWTHFHMRTIDIDLKLIYFFWVQKKRFFFFIFILWKIFELCANRQGGKGECMNMSDNVNPHTHNMPFFLNYLCFSLFFCIKINITIFTTINFLKFIVFVVLSFSFFCVKPKSSVVAVNMRI